MQHSYLEVELRNDHVAADELCLGLGAMSWCDSMRVTQGSVTLEHIRNYGELHAMLQMCQQSPDKIGCDDSLMGGGPGLVGEVLQDTQAGGANAYTRRVSNDVHYNAPLLDALTPYSGGTNIVPGQTSIRLAVPLISSISATARNTSRSGCSERRRSSLSLVWLGRPVPAFGPPPAGRATRAQPPP